MSSLRFLLAFAALLLISRVGASHGEDLLPLEGMQGLTVFCDTEEKLLWMQKLEHESGFDVAKVGSYFVDVLVAAEKVDSFKSALQRNGMKYAVFIENVKDVVVKEYMEQQIARRSELLERRSGFFKKLSFTYYLDSEEINDYLDEVAKEYKHIVTQIVIGRSFEGRPMKGLKISTGGRKKPAIFIDAGIHAREWIAPATALYIIEQLLTDPANRRLLDNVDWFILPLVNPDGYQFTHDAPQNRLWRKTRSVNPKTSCRGADGNRNFDLGWMWTGASSDPCDLTYAGNSAFSEPETRAIRDFVLAQNTSIKLYLTLHSYGQYLLYPWGHITDLPENESTLRALAQKVSKAIASVAGTRYTYGSSATTLYPAAGGSDDWTMGKGGVDLAYTIELPGGIYGFQLPASKILPVGRETFEGIKVYHDYVAANYK